jgi:hypothetical protein
MGPELYGHAERPRRSPSNWPGYAGIVGDSRSGGRGDLILAPDDILRYTLG